jgi:hypothetical protein
MPKVNSRKGSKKMIGCSMMGGNGATGHGVATYGAVGQQSAGQGNLILMKGGEPEVGSDPLLVADEGSQDGGNTVIGNLLVPAGLLVASQYASRRSKKRGGKKSSRKSRRNRKSRRRP